MKITAHYVAMAVLLTVLAWASPAPGPGQAGEAGQGAKGGGSMIDKFFIYDAKPLDVPPEVAAKMKREQAASSVEATRLLSLDGTRIEGAPYADFVWLWKGSSKGYVEEEHVHDFDEYIGFIGTRGPQDPRGRGGEMEVWLGGEKYLITKSCLIYGPRGLKHCPIRFNRIDSPILFFTGSLGGKDAKYTRTPTPFSDAKAAERNYEKYISYGVNPVKLPPEEGTPEAAKMAEMRAQSGSTVVSTRLLDLDRVEGAPYIDFAWLYEGHEKKVTHPEHSHDWGEIFGYVGAAEQADPRDLGGEVEFWIQGEKRTLTKSCLVWIPPAIPHCPVRFARIDRPILWFTIGIGMRKGAYTFTPTAPAKK